MPTYKPTREDCERIRQAAAREAVPRIPAGAVVLEPGWRGSTTRPSVEVSLNMALVSNDWPNCSDTDLSDYGTWAEFRKGVPLTEDGRGIVDFYIRRRGDEYKDLHGNVTIEIAAGKLVRVYGYGNKADYFNVK